MALSFYPGCPSCWLGSTSPVAVPPAQAHPKSKGSPDSTLGRSAGQLSWWQDSFVSFVPAVLVGQSKARSPSPGLACEQSSAWLLTASPAAPAALCAFAPDRFYNPLALNQEIQENPSRNFLAWGWECVPSALVMPTPITPSTPVPQSILDRAQGQSPGTKQGGKQIPTVDTTNASRALQWPLDFTVLTCPIAFSKHARFSKLKPLQLYSQNTGRNGDGERE